MIGSFVLGMFVMAMLVMLLCIFMMRYEKKQPKLTPPETMEFYIPNVGLQLKLGDTVYTKRTAYTVEKLYNDSLLLRRGLP